MKWISVKDRLPEVGQHVLCCMATPDGWWFGCCKYQEFGFPWVQFNNPNPVQYWQLIPEPPNEDNKALPTMPRG